eukprot:m.49565 g.49565  ORF g.49565 m.49565 type:complete len:171 (-) comp10872_c1_seq2:1094-1606(-)
MYVHDGLWYCLTFCYDLIVYPALLLTQQLALLKANGGYVNPMRGERERRNSNNVNNGNGEMSNDEQGAKFLAGADEKLIDKIRSEIMDSSPGVHWDDIAGLLQAKKAIMEMVIWPMKRPDLFHGLRAMPKGVLLFGPPGTGKTMIGKCIASQSNATFFSISASSMTSKWV